MPYQVPTFRADGQPSRQDQNKEADGRRRKAKPWRNWYSSKAWQAIRARQLAIEPTCRRHAARGEVVAATVVNHVKPHRGNWTLFVNGPFESLCKPCHDIDVQREEAATRATEIKT